MATRFSQRIAERDRPKEPLVRLGLLITLLGTVLGGAWKLFEFSYLRYIEPRLTPALIQVTADASYVNQVDCCNLIEIATRIENKGSREVIIHASQQVVGASRLEIAPDLSASSAAAMISSTNLLNLTSSGQKPIGSIVTKYIAARTVTPSLLLSVGSLVMPTSRLGPGEHYVNRSIAVVPKDHHALSVRGMLLLSHLEQSHLEWRWAVNPHTLEPEPLPWPRNESEEYNKLLECIRIEKNEATSKQCASKIQTRSMDSFRSQWQSDSNSYSEHYAFDAIAMVKQKSSE